MPDGPAGPGAPLPPFQYSFRKWDTRKYRKCYPIPLCQRLLLIPSHLLLLFDPSKPKTRPMWRTARWSQCEVKAWFVPFVLVNLDALELPRNRQTLLEGNVTVIFGFKDGTTQPFFYLPKLPIKFSWTCVSSSLLGLLLIRILHFTNKKLGFLSLKIMIIGI